jgi:hypothetical protein
MGYLPSGAKEITLTHPFHWAKVVFNIPVIYPNKTSVLKQKVKVILSVEAIHEATKKGGG